MTKKALVLGGGGLAAIAWETGLIGGLAEDGVDLCAADFILGTSAGAYVGARIAMGENMELDAKVIMTRQESGHQPGASDPVTTETSAPTQDFPYLLGNLHKAAPGSREQQMTLQKLCALALATSGVPEERFIKVLGDFSTKLPEGAWSPRAFSCTAINCADGALQVWNSLSLVGLARAVASSCALPGVYEPITVNGNRYMDGGLLSPTNANLAKGHDTVIVIAALPPYNYADQMLEREIDALRDGGAWVEVVRPDIASIEAYGPNVMDRRRQPGSASAGYKQGQRMADTLRRFWE